MNYYHKSSILFIALLLFGCNKSHELALDGNESLTLHVRSLETNKSKKYEFSPTSTEYKAFNNWLNTNREGWKDTQVKWYSPYVLNSSYFTLQFSEETAYLTHRINGSYQHRYKNIGNSLVEIFNEYSSI